MKFILNTAVDPHFCALFDEENQQKETRQWTNRRKDAEEVWYFLEQHEAAALPLSFIGGVSGPGGFSCLRAAAGILNSLAFAKDLPVHSVRADFWIEKFLESHGQKKRDFLLNSFGESVFIKKENHLERKLLTEAARLFQEKNVFIDLLPPEKQSFFPHSLDVKFKNAEYDLLQVLLEAVPKRDFVPDYEFPAVN